VDLYELARQRLEGGAISRACALSILELPDGKVDELLDAAFILRKAYKGLKTGIQILTNARSGNCSQDCAYCAQSGASKADIETYPLIPYEKAAANGALVHDKHLERHCIGLSGIRFSDAEISALCDYIRKLKEQSPVSICCSIGFLTKKQALMLKEAGLNRVNHNLNTGRGYYPQICGTHTYDERIANLKMLKELGFELCCGGIAGMGESAGDLVDMFFEIEALKPESVPVNFLIPIEGTPKENSDTSRITPEFCLKILALARFMTPKADIRCAAGRELYLAGRERDMLKAANSVFASGYLTSGGQNVDDTIAAIKNAGFEHTLE
jgi:biotin synthase